MKKKKLGILILMSMFTLFWIGIMLFFSSQNGAQTEQTGRNMAQFIKNLLHLKNDVYQIHREIRKIAHILLFLVFGFLLTIILDLAFYKRNKKLFMIILLLGSSFSYLDEAHKILIKGRHFNFDDVIRNLAGYIFGCLLAFFLVWIWKKCRKKLKNNKSLNL